MPYGAHLNGDSRNCGATTIVTGQSTVFVNGKLWAVEGDKNSHGNGDLIPVTGHTVIVEGKEVIVNGPDNASADDASHPNPQTAAGSGDTLIYWIFFLPI